MQLQTIFCSPVNIIYPNTPPEIYYVSPPLWQELVVYDITDLIIK